MKKHRFLLKLFLCIVLSVSGAAAEETLNENIVSDNAKWIMHFNAQEFWQSEIGTNIIDAFSEETHKKLDRMAYLWGSCPVSDIDSITFYGAAAPEDTVLIIKGYFDRNELEKLAEKNSHYNSYYHGSYKIHSWQKKADIQDRYAVFAAPGILIMSQSADAIEHAVDVFEGRRPATDSGKKNFQAGEGLFLSVWGGDINSLARIHGKAATLKHIKTVHITAKEDNGIFSLQTTIKAQDNLTAALLKQVFKGMASLAILSPAMAHSDPGILFEALDFSIEGRLLFIHFEHPAQDLFYNLKKIYEHR